MMNMLASLAASLIIFVGVSKAENELSDSENFKASSSEECSDSIKLHDWSLFAEINQYFIPDGKDFLLPAFSADRDWLHLEARYNYEALESSSAWIGYNFNTGKDLELNATPMVGAVIGSTMGIAPGLELELTYNLLVIYSEWEYVFDLKNSSDNFLYTWSEISISPAEWISLGLVAQRTMVYQSELEWQRGVFAAFTYARFGLTTYVLNPDIDNPGVVLNASVEF